MMKLIKENFKDLEQQIKKIREWEDKELTNDFLVDAYVLAKMIHEKYNYDIEIKPEKILSELGINVTFQESSEGVSSDYCSITLENESDINILIKYYIDRAKRSKNERFRNRGHNWEFIPDPDPIEFGLDHNTKYFYSLYALVYIIVSKQYDNIKYSIFKKQNKENDIIEKITLILLYIDYDFRYRMKRWRRDRRELPNKHPLFYGTELARKIEIERFNSMFYNRMYPTLTIPQISDSAIFHPNMSDKVISKTLKVMSILEKMEDYEKISQMLCPLDYFEKHKVDYRTFGEPIKIIFD